MDKITEPTKEQLDILQEEYDMQYEGVEESLCAQEVYNGLD